jgi:hypothetical protein
MGTAWKGDDFDHGSAPSSGKDSRGKGDGARAKVGFKRPSPWNGIVGQAAPEFITTFTLNFGIAVLVGPA